MINNFVKNKKSIHHRLAHKIRVNVLSQRLEWTFYFFVINVIIINSLALSYLNFAIVPHNLLGITFYISNSLGHFTSLALIVFLIFILPLAIIFKNIDTFIKISVIVLSILYTLFAFEVQISKNFNFHFTPLLVSNFFAIGEHGELASYWTRVYLVLPFSVLGLMLLGFWLKSYLYRANKFWFSSILFLAVTLFCFLYSHLMFAYADYRNIKDITSQRFNFPFNYPLTARDFIQQFSVQPPADADESYPVIEPSYKNIENPVNILIIDSELSQDSRIPLLIAPYKHYTLTNLYANSDNHNNSLNSLLFGIDTRYTKQFLVNQSLLTTRSQQLNYSNYLVAYNNRFNDNAKSMIITKQLSLQQLQTSPWLAIVNFQQQDFRSLQQLFEQLEQLATPTVVVITDLIAKFKFVGVNMGSNVYLPQAQNAYIVEIKQPAEQIVIDNLISNVDLAPTLLTNYLGFIGNEKQFFTGENIFAQKPSRVNQFWVMSQRERNFHLLTTEFAYQIYPNRDFVIYDYQQHGFVHHSPKLSLLVKVYGKNYNLFKLK